MDLLIEQKALKIGNILNLIMAIAGVIIFILSNSKAVLIDGLFSFIQFISTIIAVKISKDLSTSSVKQYPLGQYSKETLYVLFRSLFIIILLGASVFSGIDTIITFLVDPSLIPPIHLGSIMVNGLLLSILCFSLSLLYKHFNKKIGNCSDVLKAEAMGANLDGIISAGTAIAFVLFEVIPFLKPLIPISDAILLLLLSGFFAIQPMQLLINQINILSYKRLHPKLEKELFLSIRSQVPYLNIHDIFISKLGKFTEVYITLGLDGKFSIDELDELRYQIKNIVSSKIKNARILTIFSNLS